MIWPWLGRRDPDALRARWVVVDCETTGLDIARDHLISLGAVAVCEGRVALGESFSAVLKPRRTGGKENVLVHGIGYAAQEAGADPAATLRSFAEFAGDDPLVAFHAPFDRAILERAFSEGGLGRWRRRWLDLAELLPLLFADGKADTGLDDWLARFSIYHPARHEALGDAYATAQLLQIVLVAGRKEGYARVGELISAAGSRRWLPA